MVEAEHYRLERLLELMVMAASDILNHLLAERGETAVSYRGAFQMAAAEGLLPIELSEGSTFRNCFNIIPSATMFFEQASLGERSVLAMLQQRGADGDGGLAVIERGFFQYL